MVVDRRSMRSVLETIALLLGVMNVAALSSRECMRAVKDARRSNPGACPQSCGALRTPSDGQTFLDRLTEECAATMERYRRKGVSPGSILGYSDQDNLVCKVEKASSTQQLNIIEAANAHPFAICTIPKSGCTHLRKLLQAMMHYPDPLPYSPREQQFAAHFWRYVTIWNYDDRSLAADVYPSFTVGRNPYARLLSGFLDKMAQKSEMKDDTHTGKAVNAHLQRDGGWDGTVEDFHQFVRELDVHGVDTIDSHFRPQYRACGADRGFNPFNFEYYLRIEDQSQWFPCWEQGLNLTSYTASGWQRLKDGLETWVGGHDDFEGRIYADTQCWYTAPGFERCDQYYSATHPDWDTTSWATLKGTGAKAVPLDESLVQGDGARPTKHDTGASSSLGEWYTKEIADLVYELYKPDFEHFGYEKMEIE